MKKKRDTNAQAEVLNSFYSSSVFMRSDRNIQEKEREVGAPEMPDVSLDEEGLKAMITKLKENSAPEARCYPE